MQNSIIPHCLSSMTSIFKVLSEERIDKLREDIHAHKKYLMRNLFKIW